VLFNSRGNTALLIPISLIFVDMPFKKKQQKERKNKQQTAPATSTSGARDAVFRLPRFRNSLFPSRMRLPIHCYVNLYMAQSGNTATIFTFTVNMNNPYEPFNTAHTFSTACNGLGGAVSGFTPVPSGLVPGVLNPPGLSFLYGSSSAPYRQAKTHQFKYDVRYVPQSATDAAQLICAPLPLAGNYQASDSSSLTALPMAKFKMIVPYAPSPTVRGVVNLALLSGLSKEQWNADDTLYTCINGNAPTSSSVLQIMVQDGTNSLLFTNSIMTVRVEYDVELYNLNLLNFLE
jgi:hypothetical protein